MYDLHLAASQIALETVRVLEQSGFVRDEFANNTRCLASEYHGTYRGTRQLPDEDLWKEICDLLLSDNMFSGCLEEEAMVREVSFEGVNTTMLALVSVSPLCIMEVPAGKHKSCDIHVRINLALSAEATGQLEKLEIASFDRPAQEGVQRVYTVTCETQEDGDRLFTALSQYLRQIPHLCGKMKLEMTTRFLRYPEDAVTLPITPHVAVREWIEHFNFIP